MIDRRDLIFGGAGVAAAAAAAGLRPRRHVSLLGQRKIADLVPVSFPGWSAAMSDGLVKPKVEGLAAMLYNEIVERTYIGEKIDAEVMMLIAYGGTQSDILQLHRPEVCYPALGFEVHAKQDSNVALPGGGNLPVERMVAVAGQRQECIIYWTRLGEALPRSGSDQRATLLMDAMRGFIPDGVLVRASMVSGDPDAAFRILNGFIPAMLSAIPAVGRPSLVGTVASNQIAAATRQAG